VSPKESPGRAGGIVMLPTRTGGAPIGGSSIIKTLLFGLALLPLLILDVLSNGFLVHTVCSFKETLPLHAVTPAKAGNAG